MGPKKQLPPSHSWPCFFVGLAISAVIILGTIQDGKPLKWRPQQIDYKNALIAVSLIIGVTGALLFTAGHVYDWNHLLRLGLPPDLFVRPSRDETLVHGAIAIVSCIGRPNRWGYIFPLVAFGCYVWAQFYYEKGLGSFTVPVNVFCFFASVWVLMRGIGYFAPYDVIELEKHSLGQCFRVHKLITREGVIDRCYLMRCTPQAVAIMNPESKTIGILKREDVLGIEVGSIERPDNPEGFFLKED